MLKRNLKLIISPSNWEYLSRTYRILHQDFQYFSTHDGLLSQNRLLSYKNRYKDQRCFILGNGPSLNYMNLSYLRNEFTFGLNRIYLLFPKMGFNTSFLVSINKLIIKQFYGEFQDLKMPKFLGWYSRNFISLEKYNQFLNVHPCIRFSKNVSRYICGGPTVTFTAMQLAYYMGFKEVILIGVDHSFKNLGKPHELVQSQGADTNHFSPDYFGKGIFWQMPDLVQSEIVYQLANSIFRENNRCIVDATVDGKLNVFPKVHYEDLFD